MNHTSSRYSSRNSNNSSPNNHHLLSRRGTVRSRTDLKNPQQQLLHPVVQQPSDDDTTYSDTNIICTSAAGEPTSESAPIQSPSSNERRYYYYYFLINYCCCYNNNNNTNYCTTRRARYNKQGPWTRTFAFRQTMRELWFVIVTVLWHASKRSPKMIFLGMLLVIFLVQWFMFYYTLTTTSPVTSSSSDSEAVLSTSIWSNFVDAGRSQWMLHSFFNNYDMEDEIGAVTTSDGGDDAYPSFLDGIVVSVQNSSNPYRKSRKGVFFSNISYDYRDCTSPEINVPWPLEGKVQSKTSRLSCGMMRSSTSHFSNFFRGTLWKKHIRPLTQHCNELVVFGVAFGGDFIKDLHAPHVQKLVNATDLLQRHGHCFFIFTLEEDIEKNRNSAMIWRPNETTFRHLASHTSTGSRRGGTNDGEEEINLYETTMIGHNILIPIPRHVLPYRNPRRNVKLLKYMGQFMFRQAETVIWQDAKFFRDDFVSKQPRDYRNVVNVVENHSNSNNTQSNNACVTTMGLPVHKGTVGLENIREGILLNGRYRPQYEHHCQAIIDALIDRPTVTDSASNLIRQCDAYLQHVYLQEGNTETMNQGLIDSAFIVWNQKTQRCRDFNSALRCTIMDQIQCHSDRDQVSIPFAIYAMGLTGLYTRHPGENPRAVDAIWDPRIHDLDFVSTEDRNKGTTTRHQPTLQQGNDDVMVRVVRSSCHWYFSQLGDCRTGLSEDKPSLAIMVAGTAKRYMFTGLLDHVIKPLVQQQGYNVDYYLMLSVKQGLAYRSDDAYMRLQTFDPAFSAVIGSKNVEHVTVYMYDKIRYNISHSGANIGGIHIQPSPMKLDPPELRRKQLKAKRARPKEDSFYRFPTLDLRPEYRRKTAVANRNIFKLYLGLQKLWEKHLVTAEHYMGVRYDYVMVLKEDTMWLKDFNLDNLIASNPEADAYVPSCDIGNPTLSPMALCDHAIVIRREKASVVGRYFHKLLEMDVNQCHESVVGIAPNNTGCDSGMLFRWILEQNNITVHTVPQSLMPLERAMVIVLKDGSTEVCIHKYCQSRQDPLEIPNNMRVCRDIPV